MVGRTLTFFRRHVEVDSKTNEKTKRQPLIEEIRSRYQSEGRLEDFDQIIGDGLLWLILMGSLTTLSGDSGQLFARNLILRDITQSSTLFLKAVPEQLAGLARRIRVEETIDPIDRAKRAVQDFERLESFVQPRIDQLKVKTAKSAEVGDWLWNVGVGFGQIVELEEGKKARVHIRSRADTLNHVLISYYVNLRVLAEQDTEFRQLFDACSAP